MFQHETSTFFLNTEFFYEYRNFLKNVRMTPKHRFRPKKIFENFFYEYRFFFRKLFVYFQNIVSDQKNFWKKSPYNMPHYSYHTLEQSLVLRTHGSVLLVCLRCIVSVAKPLVVSAYPWVRLKHLAYPWIHIVYPWVHLTYPWVHLPYPWVHLTYPWAHLA